MPGVFREGVLRKEKAGGTVDLAILRGTNAFGNARSSLPVIYWRALFVELRGSEGHTSLETMPYHGAQDSHGVRTAAGFDLLRLGMNEPPSTSQKREPTLLVSATPRGKRCLPTDTGLFVLAADSF